MTEFQSARDIKAARKAHRCDWCGGRIQVGEPYRYQFMKHAGEAYSWHGHMDCVALAAIYAEAADIWGDDGIPEMLDWDISELNISAQAEFHRIMERAAHQTKSPGGDVRQPGDSVAVNGNEG